jgi:hypothetical protein
MDKGIRQKSSSKAVKDKVPEEGLEEMVAVEVPVEALLEVPVKEAEECVHWPWAQERKNCALVWRSWRRFFFSRLPADKRNCENPYLGCGIVREGCCRGRVRKRHNLG